MKYIKEDYVGKTIQLYPGDTVSKWGEILDVNDLGWTIKITRINRAAYHYQSGDVIFISHSTDFNFKFE